MNKHKFDRVSIFKNTAWLVSSALIFCSALDIKAEIKPFKNSSYSQSVQTSQNTTDSTQVETEEATIRRLSQEWIEQGFSPKEDTQNYTYEKYLAPYYNSTPGAVVLHDKNHPQMRIETDARAYSRIWEELFANLDYVDNKLTRFYQVEVEGDLALSSFTADAIVESDGKRTIIPVFYTLGWRRKAVRRLAYYSRAWFDFSY